MITRALPALVWPRKHLVGGLVLCIGQTIVADQGVFGWCKLGDLGAVSCLGNIIVDSRFQA